MWQRLPDTGGLKSMNKIEDAFKNKKAFIPFVTAGDPSLDVTRELILAMQEAGADLIEIGIPFSDPVAEGPVIQEADDRALSAGVTTDKIFDMVDGGIKVAEIRVKENETLDSALRRFKKSCARSGVLSEVKKREQYDKPSVKKKKKSAAVLKQKDWWLSQWWHRLRQTVCG